MTASGIITAIIIGAIVGALGRLLVPGRQNLPVWLTIVVGIVAALLGSVLAGALGVRDTSGFDWMEFFIQLVLAAVGGVLDGRDSPPGVRVPVTGEGDASRSRERIRVRRGLHPAFLHHPRYLGLSRSLLG